jgi:hypothetical protein
MNAVLGEPQPDCRPFALTRQLPGVLLRTCLSMIALSAAMLR